MYVCAASDRNREKFKPVPENKHRSDLGRAGDSDVPV